LNAFGEDMVKCAKDHQLVAALPAQQYNIDQDNHTLIYERNNLIFIFNFSPGNSIPDYRFKVPNPGRYKIILNTDKSKYGGFDRVDDGMEYPTVTLFGEHFLSIYLPNRVSLVLEQVEE
jgi:1,4-alpha-glucan branching enzyme